MSRDMAINRSQDCFSVISEGTELRLYREGNGACEKCIKHYSGVCPFAHVSLREAAAVVTFRGSLAFKSREISCVKSSDWISDERDSSH